MGTETSLTPPLSPLPSQQGSSSCSGQEHMAPSSPSSQSKSFLPARSRTVSSPVRLLSPRQIHQKQRLPWTNPTCGTEAIPQVWHTEKSSRARTAILPSSWDGGISTPEKQAAACTPLAPSSHPSPPHTLGSQIQNATQKRRPLSPSPAPESWLR